MPQEQKPKVPSRDEKARAELQQKVMGEAQDNIGKAVALLNDAMNKMPEQQRPYIAMDVVNKILDTANCKTVVVHQPQIVPLSAEEIKKKVERAEQEKKMQEAMQQEATRRTDMEAKGEVPKTAPPAVEPAKPVEPPK